MEMTDLACFLAAADLGSFTAASEQMFMTRQAVSRRVRRLEQDLCVPLFVREHSELVLTSSGELLRNFLVDADLRFQELKKEMAQTKNTPVPHIQISCIHGIDTWRLLNKAMQTVQQHHDFEVDIAYHSPDSIIESLEAGRQDLYITFRPGDESAIPSHYQWITMSHVDMCLAVGKEHPLCRTATSAQDFSQESAVTWLRRNDTEDSCRRQCIRTFREKGFNPRRILIYPNMESAHAAIEFCKGVGLCSTVSKLVTSPAVTCYPLGSGADLVCIYKRSGNSAAAQALVSELDCSSDRDEKAVTF